MASISDSGPTPATSGSDGQTSDAARAAPCRLCGGRAAFAFAGRLLNRYDVSYFRCSACGSLETEEPYWLATAYADDQSDGANNLADLDTGAANRSVGNAAAVAVVARVLGLNNISDFGGGDGLLCRLLRDVGYNAYVSDRYAMATYARGFTSPDFQRPDIVTAFEVLEHLADPVREVEQLFTAKPAVVMITTERYEGQGPDWWYLLPDTGQHVFFYSERGLELLGERFGYRVVRAGIYTLYIAPEFTGLRIALLRQMLRHKPLKLARATMAMRDAPGIAVDYEALKMRHDQATGRTASS